MTINIKVLLPGAHNDRAFVTAAIAKMTSESYSSGVWSFTISPTCIEGVDYTISTYVDGGVTYHNPWPSTDNTITIQRQSDYASKDIADTGGKRSQINFLDTDTVDILYQRIWHELLHTISGIRSADMMNNTPAFTTWLAANGITLTNYPTPEGQSDSLVNLLTWDRYLTTLARIVTAAPTATVAVDVGDGLINKPVTFTTTVTSGSPISWLWNFSDGTVSSALNPQHIYLAAGTYLVTFTLNGEYSSTVISNTVTIRASNLAFTHNISATNNNHIQAVEFDTGGEGVAYHDTTIGTEPGCVPYPPRPDTVSVDIEKISGSAPSPNCGYNVCYIRNGEWLRYTVNVINAGNYSIEYTYSTPNSGCIVGVYDGTSILTALSLPVTSSFSTWSVNKPTTLIYLSKGVHTLYIKFNGVAQNFLSINFLYATISQMGLPSTDFVANVTTGYEPLPVQFTDRSVNTPTSWSWNFGDGGSSTSQNPSHTYTAAGTYTVTMIATNAGGADNETKTNYITVMLPPVATPQSPTTNFIVDKTIGISGSTIFQFTDKSTGAPTKWIWDVGDGSISNGAVQNIKYTYYLPGTYTVKLTTSNASGSDTMTKTGYIIVSGPPVPVAGFTYAISDTNSRVVAFTDTSTNSPTSWLWDMGDGAYTNLRNPVYTYLTVGTYTITLVATNANGSSTVYTKSITTVAPPTPATNFSTSIDAGMNKSYTGITIKFTDTSAFAPTSWAWSFGDGATSTLQNPTHIYTVVGTYNVTLIATNMTGSSTLVRENCAIITAADSGHPVPVADFVVDAVTGDTNHTFKFTDTSTISSDTITHWLWTFGDGTTSNEQNPTHRYVTGEIVYDVRLTVASDYHDTTVNRIAYINVSTAVIELISKPTALFIVTTDGIKAPVIVKFTDKSQFTPTSWLWDFGDKSGSISIEQNPTHTYENAGIYTVTLTATNNLGSSVFTIQIPVIPPNSNTPGIPIADCYNVLDQLTIPIAVSFYDKSTGIPTSWFWSFGDGTTSTEQNPVHTYTVAGTYSIIHTVTNNLGSNTQTFDLAIAGPSDGKPTTAYTKSVSSGKSPLKVQFYDKTPIADAVTSWLWDFGDGATSVSQNPTHTYIAIGKYSVMFTATNKYGSTMVYHFEEIVVSELGSTSPLNAAFHASPSTGKHPLTVKFINDSTGPYRVSFWQFGDGSTSFDTNPVKTYTAIAAKKYTVTLTVSTIDNLTSTVAYMDYIDAAAPDAAPVASALDFSADIIACEQFTPIQFSMTSSGVVTDIDWTFGTEFAVDTSTLRSPLFSYNVPGLYTVTLIAKVDGTEHTVIKRNYIRVTKTAVAQPVTDFNVSKSSGILPVVVDFTDLTTNYPYTWYWNFGDGTYSEMQNPSHTYKTAGLYNVTLTATNKLGSVSKVRTGIVEVLTEEIINRVYTGVYEYNMGWLTVGTNLNADSYNLTYRPNVIRAAYGTYEVMISRLSTAIDEQSEVGLTFGGSKELRVDTSKELQGLPITGYGVYMDFRSNAIVIKRFDVDAKTTTLHTEYLDETLISNRLYTLKIERYKDGYIAAYVDGKYICRVFDINHLDGYAGIIIHDTNSDGQYAFDDMVFDEMVYSHTPNASVYMGGVSHGGKFNHINRVENKFIPGLQIPLGKYYAEICLIANTYAEVVLDYKNFSADIPISYESFDNLNSRNAETTCMISLGAHKTTYNVKIDLDGTYDVNQDCGIVVRDNDPNAVMNYKPVVVVEYIALAPIASNVQQTMFPQDMSMLCFTKPSTYRKLENKRVW